MSDEKGKTMNNSNIVIIGAGFAGMWSALSAARLVALNHKTNIKVTVLAPQPELRIRPRLYEANASTLAAPLLPLFKETGVDFISCTAEKIDAANKSIWFTGANGEQQSINYDKLILASGSQLSKDGIEGAHEYAFDIDQLENAEKLERHLQSLSSLKASEARHTFVVCGGGLTGIELATELPKRVKAILGSQNHIKVIVVDSGAEIGSSFSPEMRQVISEASKSLEIEWKVNSRVQSINDQGVTLNDGSFIPSLTVMLTAGVKASLLTEQITGARDARGRLHVNEYLQVKGHEDIYATGDVAYAASDEEGNYALMTCQHAIPLGKFAGNNASASLVGLKPIAYTQPNYVTCVDLGAWGAVYTETWNQHVKSTQEEAKKIKIAITNELIYPPKADREIVFKQADPLAPFV